MVHYLEQALPLIPNRRSKVLQNYQKLTFVCASVCVCVCVHVYVCVSISARTSNYINGISNVLIYIYVCEHVYTEYQ